MVVEQLWGTNEFSSCKYSEFKPFSVLANSHRNQDGSSGILAKTIHRDVQMSVVVVSGTPQPWGLG